MTIATKLPSVLQQPHGNSLSVERVLKMAKGLLEQAEGVNEDRVVICLEDLEVLIQNIE